MRRNRVGEPGRDRRSNALGCLGDESIDDCLEITRALERRQLPVGARSLPHDLERVLDLLPASELVDDVIYEPGEHLGDQLAGGKLLILAEVDQLAIETEPHGSPLVLFYIRGRIDAEGHVVAAELPELRNNRLENGSDADGLFDSRTDVADAELQSGVGVVRPRSCSRPRAAAASTPATTSST